VASEWLFAGKGERPMAAFGGVDEENPFVNGYKRLVEWPGEGRE